MAVDICIEGVSECVRRSRLCDAIELLGSFLVTSTWRVSEEKMLVLLERFGGTV